MQPSPAANVQRQQQEKDRQQSDKSVASNNQADAGAAPPGASASSRKKKELKSQPQAPGAGGMYCCIMSCHVNIIVLYVCYVS